MKITRFAVIAAIVAMTAIAPGFAQGRVNNLSVSVNIIGRGITGIGPTTCSVAAGVGSANAPVCQFTATTVPGGQAVTWAITGGVDAAKFALTTAGALSVGTADLLVSATPYLLTVTATGQ